MTAEKRVLISPQDIIAVGYECPHCRATYFAPVDKIDRIAAVCHNCQQRLLGETQPQTIKYSDITVVRHFVEFLQQLQSREFGAILRFEIGGDMKLDTKA